MKVSGPSMSPTRVSRRLCEQHAPYSGNRVQLSNRFWHNVGVCACLDDVCLSMTGLYNNSQALDRLMWLEGM